MRIIEDKALLLKVRNPKQITTVIPKSKELSMNKVLVNWGIFEALKLKSLNINVPSPITKRYSWPGQYKPFEHQKDTASFLTMNKGGIVILFSSLICISAAAQRGVDGD